MVFPFPVRAFRAPAVPVPAFPVPAPGSGCQSGSNTLKFGVVVTRVWQLPSGLTVAISSGPTNVIFLPSGDHAGPVPLTGSELCSVPLAFMILRSVEPWNTMRRPSGDQSGPLSDVLLLV